MVFHRKKLLLKSELPASLTLNKKTVQLFPVTAQFIILLPYIRFLILLSDKTKFLCQMKTTIQKKSLILTQMKKNSTIKVAEPSMFMDFKAPPATQAISKTQKFQP